MVDEIVDFIYELWEDLSFVLSDGLITIAILLITSLLHFLAEKYLSPDLHNLFTYIHTAMFASLLVLYLTITVCKIIQKKVFPTPAHKKKIEEREQRKINRREAYEERYKAKKELKQKELQVRTMQLEQEYQAYVQWKDEKNQLPPGTS